MARVSVLSAEALPVELRSLFERFSDRSGADHGDFRHQAGVLAHAPGAFRHLYGLVEAMRREGELPQRLVEIAVVTTSAVNRCKYCVAHHGPMLRGMGLAAQTIERILEDDVPGLDETERLVRDYARLVTERPWGIPERVIERLGRAFTERQIVELTVRIGLCGLFNKLNDALQIELEPGLAGPA